MDICNFCKAPISTIFPLKTLKLGWVSFPLATFQLKFLDFQSNQYKRKLVPVLSLSCRTSRILAPALSGFSPLERGGGALGLIRHFVVNSDH